MNAAEHIKYLRDLGDAMTRAHNEAADIYQLIVMLGDCSEYRHRLREANHRAASAYYQRREAMVAARLDGVDASDIGRACRLAPARVKVCVEGWHVDSLTFVLWRQERERLAGEAERDAYGQDYRHAPKPAVMPHRQPQRCVRPTIGMRRIERGQHLTRMRNS